MQIARELVSMLRKNTTIDWTIKENVQAKLRVYVKKLLRKYNYPPLTNKKMPHRLSLNKGIYFVKIGAVTTKKLSAIQEYKNNFWSESLN